MKKIHGFSNHRCDDSRKEREVESCSLVMKIDKSHSMYIIRKTCKVYRTKIKVEI